MTLRSPVAVLRPRPSVVVVVVVVAFEFRFRARADSPNDNNFHDDMRGSEAPRLHTCAYAHCLSCTHTHYCLRRGVLNMAFVPLAVAAAKSPREAPAVSPVPWACAGRDRLLLPPLPLPPQQQRWPLPYDRRPCRAVPSGDADAATRAHGRGYERHGARPALRRPRRQRPARAPAANLHMTTSSSAVPPATGAERGLGRIEPLDRASFRILEQCVHDDKPLVYLDSSATSQKPQRVLDALHAYYTHDNANVHRGAHALSGRATDAFERARARVGDLIHAPRREEEVVFTRNATEAINTVAYAWGLLGGNLRAGDEILLSVAEHHSNLVPWQLVAAKSGAVLRFVPLTPDSEEYDMQAFYRLLSDRTKVVALPHVSNVLGSVQPVAEVARAAHAVGARVLVDACQSVPHMPVDVRALDCDWLVASGHKMCGPTGVGFLYGKREVLRDEMPPFLGGGEMIGEVGLESSTFAMLPHKFEAGTPAIGEAVALGAAVDYLLEDLGGMQRVHEFEQRLGRYLYDSLTQFEEVRVYGPPPRRPSAGVRAEHGADGDAPSGGGGRGGRGALCTFSVDGVHPNDLATMLDMDGVAIRAGHHCAQPLHREVLGVESSARASLYVYNSSDDVDALIDAMRSAVELLGGKLTPAARRRG